jgi:hypothetical protein
MTPHPAEGAEDPAIEPVRAGVISRRGLIVAGIATGAAVVWSAPFPFADAVIGQGIAQAADGPTGPTGPAAPTGGTGTVVPTGATGTAATGATGGVKRKGTLSVRHSSTSRRVHPGQWFGQTVVVTAHGATASKVSISIPTPKGLVRVAGKSRRTAAIVKPGHSLRLQTVYIATPDAVGSVIPLRPKVTAGGITKTSVSVVNVTVVPKA